MRTRDFSAAPLKAQATAMFVGGTRYSGLGALVRLAPSWVRFVRAMRRADGYCGHHVYWEPPLTLGTIALFRDRESLLRFARSDLHANLMTWLTDGRRNATAGFIRLYDAQPSGYSNGQWRAEGDVMGHIPRFTPLPGEERGPRVVRS